MKKLLISVLTIALVVGVGAYLTNAFFSDEEKSTGNTFQAGAVDLLVDSECHYFQNGQDVGCTYTDKDGKVIEFGNWISGNLTTEKFYAFDDIKPGDYGENTLSLTVEDNDAYACMYIENAQNLENDLIDPEAEAGDISPAVGELAQNLHFTAWLDQGLTLGWQGKDKDQGEGDNVWQGRELEPLLFSNVSGPASDVLDGKVYDLNALGGLKGGVTHYVGIYWCAGNLTIVGDAIKCDGSTMSNESQTDSLSADVRFYVEQQRNNAEFVCPPLPPKVVVGDNFAPEEGPTWVTKARFGDNNPTAGSYEIEVGRGAATRKTNNTSWVSGTSYPFKLTYDGSGNATLLINNISTTYDNTAVGYLALTSGDSLGITAKTKNDGSVAVTGLKLNGSPLAPDNVTAPGVGPSDYEHIFISGVDLSSGFTIEGTYTPTWIGTSDERPALEIHVEL